MTRRRPDPERPPAEIPAHNLEIERAVLGAMMQPDADAAEILGLIRERGVNETTFYPDAHRAIFRQLAALTAAGRPTTAATVVSVLREGGELDAVGGEVVVNVIAADATVPALVPGHADELVRLAVKRDAEQGGRLFVEHARNGAEPAELAADLRVLLERLESATPMQPACVDRVGDEFTVTWPRRGVVLEFQAARAGSDGTRADVAVVLRGRELDWGALPLASTTARVSRAGKLLRLAPGLPWGEMLDTACAQVARLLRAGEPATVLVPGPRQGEPYLIEPLIPASGRPTVVHADGGSGKSLLAVALALARFYGLALPGLKAPSVVGPCLYLDWETDETTAKVRTYRVARGLGVSGEGAIVYRRMEASLVEAAAAIRRDARYYGTDFVVVDSLQYAVAGSDRGDVALPYTQAFNVLRSLGPGVEALVLAHHSHAGDDKREAHPYGSRFIHNACGARWELRVDHEDATDLRPAALLQALYNRKMNDDALRPPLAVRMVFDDGDSGPVRLERGAVSDSPALLKRAPLRQRIRSALGGGALDAATLATNTEESVETVRRTLERYAGKDWARLPNTKPLLWGLLSGRA